MKTYMSARDLLFVAGLAAEALERHGVVACGRRENGATRIEFWTRNGKSYSHDLRDENATVDEIVAICLSLAGLHAAVSVSASALN
jgi:hypothetical protein